MRWETSLAWNVQYLPANTYALPTEPFLLVPHISDLRVRYETVLLLPGASSQLPGLPFYPPILIRDNLYLANYAKIVSMFNSTQPSSAASAGNLEGGGSSTRAQVPNLSNDEFREFRKIYETRVLPAITQTLSLANVGGQVLFRRRKYITVVTGVETTASLKHQIECAVAAELPADFRARICVEFDVGEVVRS
ncbi:hypothetical protein GGR55DRAFT_303698 [Xylaria sp. FL0064]|nr:hypothetical protein GGR55DRAFT_303698 [Xylaria sp. FL0064]